MYVRQKMFSLEMKIYEYIFLVIFNAKVCNKNVVNFVSSETTCN